MRQHQDPDPLINSKLLFDEKRNQNEGKSKGGVLRGEKPPPLNKIFKRIDFMPLNS